MRIEIKLKKGEVLSTHFQTDILKYILELKEDLIIDIYFHTGERCRLLKLNKEIIKAYNSLIIK